MDRWWWHYYIYILERGRMFWVTKKFMNDGEEKGTAKILIWFSERSFGNVRGRRWVDIKWDIGGCMCVVCCVQHFEKGDEVVIRRSHKQVLNSVGGVLFRWNIVSLHERGK